jgi:DNA adenine methylase
MKRYTTKGPKPFLKWVGGKTQLLSALENRLPFDFCKTVRVYAEPFVGGGALLFCLLGRGMRPERVVINDSNRDWANAYRTVREHAADLDSELGML